MPKYRLVSSNEFPSIDPARIGKVDVAYVYMDENFQTVSFRVPLEEDSDERVHEELRKKAAARARGGAREYDVP